MAVDEVAMRKYLQAFDFKSLFIEFLGWNRANINHELQVDNHTYNLQAVADKEGFGVYVCSTALSIPDYPIRQKIDVELSKRHFEHMIIYSDGSSRQVWQWVKREKGNPIRYREQSWNTGQSGTALIQRLKRIAFDFEDELSLNLIEVTKRAKKAFDVETVTKGFYDKFKTQHAQFLVAIKGISSEDDKAWYASVMLNRLMFVYFIQFKGFLDDDRQYLRTKLQQCKSQFGNNEFHSFYRSFLLRLFHDGLGKPASDRDRALQELIGNVPYLNGGIFAPHSIEVNYNEIQVPDTAFEQLFNFFDSYKWHLDERPLKDGNEINPDVLGFIFEKYINQKQMGAYYTKEDITEYIGRNTIIPYLFDAAKEKCPIAFEKDSALWKLLKDNPNRYIFKSIQKGMQFELPEDIDTGIHDVAARGGWNRPASEQYALPTEIWREVVARRQRYEEIFSKLSNGEIHTINDLITYNLDIRQFAEDAIRQCEGPELLRAFWQSIEKVRVLDPTVGSGAFLFAALNILEPLYEACLQRMRIFIEDAKNSSLGVQTIPYQDFIIILNRIDAHPSHAYFIYKSIIVNNLYGVDIMEEATEICKLRLFLKLAAQLETVKQIEPLPDIDFNIRSGNTLVGYTSIEDISRLWKLAEFKNLNTTGSMIFDRDHEKMKNLVREYGILVNEFRDQQLGIYVGKPINKKEIIDSADRDIKPDLDQDIWKLCRKIVKLDEKISEIKFKANYQPFHWFLEFPDAMAHGGFNVIIGNPPYVKRNEITRYNLFGYQTIKCPDIYANVLERSRMCAGQNARMGFIVPLSVTFSGQYKSLRAELLSHLNCWFSSYDNIPASIFSGVSQRCTIILSENISNNTIRNYTCSLKRWRSDFRNNLTNTLDYTEMITCHYSLETIPKYYSTALRNIYNQLLRMKNISNHRVAKFESDFKLGYSQSARNYITTFINPPPCLNATTYSPIEGEEVGWITTTSLDETFRFHALTSGDLFFWYWLVIGDGFHVTNWMIDEYLSSFKSLSNLSFNLIEILGKYIHSYRFSSLQFKKNAGKYVGSYNYRQLSYITRRIDILACILLDIDLNSVIDLFGYIERVLAVNIHTGEKGIPDEIKQLYPADNSNSSDLDQIIEEIDRYIINHYNLSRFQLVQLIDQNANIN